MTVSRFGTVGGKAHAGEERCPFGLVEEAEQDRGHAAFAVVFMILDPGMMITIRIAPLPM